MATMRKFLFETDFDPHKRKKPAIEETPVEEAPPPPPPPPTVLESQAVQMAEDAYQRGLAEGEAKGRAEGETRGRTEAANAFAESVERETAAGLNQIAQTLAALVQTHRDAMNISAQEALRVVHAAVKALHPVYCERHGGEEAAAVVTDALDRLRDEPQATVRVSEKTVDALQDALDPVLDRLGFQGELILQVDETLGPADVDVEWRGGSARRSSDAIAEAVLAAIAKAIPAPEPAAEDATESADPETGGAAES